MEEDQESPHNVNFNILSIQGGYIVRNPHQNIKAVVNGRLGIEEARILLELLQKQVESYEEGKGPITFTMIGEFT